MTRYDPDWEQGLKTSPIQKQFFTEQLMDQVEAKIRHRSASSRRQAWRMVSLPLAVLSLILVFVFVFIRPTVLETVKQQVQTWFSTPDSHEQLPIDKERLIDPSEDEQVPDSAESEEKELRQDDTPIDEFAAEVQFKGRTVAWDVPDYWLGHNVFMVEPGQYYEMRALDGNLVKITNGEQTGWLPAWYLAEDESELITDVAPYEMVVGHPAMIYAYPDEEAPTLFEMERGRVVQVKQRYEDWAAVEIRLYAEPIPGAMWMPLDALVPYEERLAKEGYFRLDQGGTPIYRDLEQNILADHITRKLSAWIVEEYEEMYMIAAPGGISGYIQKENFIPNPFDLRKGTYLELSLQAEEAFHRFIDSREDQDLAGLTPLELYQIYHHAIVLGDMGLQFDLLAHEQAGVPDRETYIKEAEEQADLNRAHALHQAIQAAETEVIVEYHGDEAYIRPMHTGEESWFFRLVQTADGIWKAAWLARQ